MRHIGFVGAIVALLLGITACGDGEGADSVATPGYDILRGGEEGHCVLSDGGGKQLVDCAAAHNVEITVMVDYPGDMA